MQRALPDGGMLSWRLTIAPAWAAGVVPFLIEWGEDIHPSQSSADGAASRTSDRKAPRSNACPCGVERDGPRLRRRIRSGGTSGGNDQWTCWFDATRSVARTTLDVRRSRQGHICRSAPPCQDARRGRATSSPPQFGQTSCVEAAHVGQNVHSKLQIRAAPSFGSATPQASQVSRISSTAASFR